ncbi:AMP-binding protein [bacterium]|nr:AMP-binding protein [bacterium]
MGEFIRLTKAISSDAQLSRSNALWEMFHLTAEDRPDNYALCWEQSIGGLRYRCTRYTFRQLYDAANEFANEITRFGFAAESKVLLLVPISPSFIVSMLGLIGIGCCPVLVDPRVGSRTLRRVVDEVRPDGVIATPLAYSVGLLRQWGLPKNNVVLLNRSLSTRLSFARIPCFSARGVESSGEPLPAIASRPAAIVYTTGTTGASKGVVHTEESLLGMLTTISEIAEFSGNERDLATFPLFAVFAPLLGVTSIISSDNFASPSRVNATRLLQSLRRHEVTNVFTAPALLARIADALSRSTQSLKSLRRILVAGAPTSGDLLVDVKQRVGNSVRVISIYGATEAMPISHVEADSAFAERLIETGEGRGILVGSPCCNAKVKILQADCHGSQTATWQPEANEGQRGEIFVHGPMVSPTYLRSSDNNHHKVMDVGGRLWHRTGDIGYLDSSNLLWFCGRVSDRVVINGLAFDSLSCERVFERHPLVIKAAYIKIDRGNAERCVAIVQCRRCHWPRGLIERLRKELQDMSQQVCPPIPVDEVLIRASMPVDFRHNSKTVYSKLRHWARRKLAREIR